MELAVVIVIYFLLIGMYLFELWLSILNYKHRNAPIPDSVKDVYNDKEYKKHQKYTMENFKFSLIEKGFNRIILIVFLLSGFFKLISEVANKITDNNYLQVLLFLLLYFLITFIIDIFFDYYHTFKIEEKYGFNRTTKKTFTTDKIKSLLLTILFGGGIVYGILVLHDETTWLFFVYAWLALTIIMIVINMIYTKVLVPLFNKLTPLEKGSLRTKIEEFAQSVGYEIDKISIMDASKRSTKLNAFFSGFGKTKRIVLFDTLVEKMDDEEIVSVLAHEIGHNKHKHIIFNLLQTSIVLSVYVLLLGLLLEIKVFSTAFGFANLNIGFNLILYTIIVSPILMLINIFSSFLSRKFEYQADKFVADNYKKDKFISALKKLARSNYSNLTPHPLYVKLFYSHPPISDRIEAIK
ncbi:MAG: M48 family metallopeptidase [Candidatus Izimaplasma sp.]|nr:M48 family metallopeptidase [Candidatus Izimaplasma bacterium]